MSDYAPKKYPTDHLIIEHEDKYHSRRDQHLTSHQFIEFCRSPVYYHGLQSGLFATTIPQGAATFGSAMHMALLEPDRYAEVYREASPPVNEKTGKPYGEETKKHRDWIAGLGGQVVTPEQGQLIEFLCDKARDDSRVSEILGDGAAERVARINWCGVDVQARFDWISHTHGLVDIKTTRGMEDFDADAQRYGYHIQQAFYFCVYLIATGRPLNEDSAAPIHMVAVEKKPPYRVQLRVYDAPTVWRLMRYVMLHMAEYSACEASNNWPARGIGPRTLEPWLWGES